MRDHTHKSNTIYGLLVNGSYRCTSGGDAFRPMTFDTKDEAKQEAAYVMANSSVADDVRVVKLTPTPEPGMKHGPDFDILAGADRSAAEHQPTPPAPATDGGIGAEWLPPETKQGHIYPATVEGMQEMLFDERAAWRLALRRSELARQEAEKRVGEHWMQLQAAERERDRLKDRLKDRLDSIEAYGVENASNVLDLIKSRDAAIAERDGARKILDRLMVDLDKAEAIVARLENPESVPGLVEACGLAGHRACSVTTPTERGTWVPAVLKTVLTHHHPKPEARGEETPGEARTRKWFTDEEIAKSVNAIRDRVQEARRPEAVIAITADSGDSAVPRWESFLNLTNRVAALESLRCDRTARNVDEWIAGILTRLDTLESAWRGMLGRMDGHAARLQSLEKNRLPERMPCGVGNDAARDTAAYKQAFAEGWNAAIAEAGR